MNDDQKVDEKEDDIIKKFLALIEKKHQDQRIRIENISQTLATLRKVFEKRKNKRSKCLQERLRNPDLGRNL